MVSEKQKRLFVIACLFDKACRDNNIKYSLACGTMLGGIREKGFISWDEDFDILMSIYDYNNFEKISIEYADEFSWVSYRMNKSSPVVYARVYEKEVDLHHLEEYPYIDIHVYVAASNDESIIKSDLNKVDFLTKCFWVKQRKYHNIFHRRKSFIGAICKVPLVCLSTEWCAKRIESYSRKYLINNSGFQMPIQGYYKIKEVIPNKWLENYIDIVFEGRIFMVLSVYHEYLTKIYGDYMTPVKYNH